LDHSNRSPIPLALDAGGYAVLVAEHAGDSMVVTDADGNFLWVNQAFEAMSGYTLADLVGQKPGAILQGRASDSAARAELSAARREGRATRVEIVNYHKSGRLYDVEIDMRPVCGPDGVITHFIATQREITLRRQRENDLEMRRDLAKALVDASGEGIWMGKAIFGADGRVRDFRWVEVNPAAERLLQRGIFRISFDGRLQVAASLLELVRQQIEQAAGPSDVLVARGKFDRLVVVRGPLLAVIRIGGIAEHDVSLGCLQPVVGK
jgi:PAS domain S-box-containing protein